MIGKPTKKLLLPILGLVLCAAPLRAGGTCTDGGQDPPQGAAPTSVTAEALDVIVFWTTALWMAVI